MKINGKNFTKVSTHTKKSIANQKAASARAKGRLARVVSEKNKQNKTVYVVYTAASGGAPSKTRGQIGLGGFGRKVLKPSGRQTGKTNVSHDKKRKAMLPGKRRSASGNIYTETRRNRSDLSRNTRV